MQLACLYNFYIPWDSTFKEAYNYTRYGRVHNCKYSITIYSKNNWVILNFLDDGTDNVEYRKINRTINDGNAMKMSLIFTKVNHGVIDADNYSCHGYHIIKISSYPDTLQSDLNINGQFISSDEMLCEGNHYFPFDFNPCYYVSPENKSNNTIVSLRKMINIDVNVKCYDYNDVVTSFLRTISHNDFISLIPLHVPVEENENLMDKIFENKALNLRYQYRQKLNNALMNTMTNFRIAFK